MQIPHVTSSHYILKLHYVAVGLAIYDAYGILPAATMWGQLDKLIGQGSVRSVGGPNN
jgi:hypothetical protein